ncbi:MAG: hypothetical protein V7K40_11615 [Nostoc sp.]|uniref:hypothetical protein n=1 Tax=Nostoc sp. TaxID=1180 RepID=UPI002FF9EB83
MSALLSRLVIVANNTQLISSYFSSEMSRQSNKSASTCVELKLLPEGGGLLFTAGVTDCSQHFLPHALLIEVNYQLLRLQI